MAGMAEENMISGQRYARFFKNVRDPALVKKFSCSRVNEPVTGVFAGTAEGKEEMDPREPHGLPACRVVTALTR